MPTLPDTPARSQQELRLRQTRGVPLVVTQGYADADVEQTYTRAYPLCQQVGDLDQMRAALLGLWRVSSMRGALKTAQYADGWNRPLPNLKLISRCRRALDARCRCPNAS